MTPNAKLIDEHAVMWKNYLNYPINRTLDLNDKESSFNESWKYDHYFSVGADALRIIMNELLYNDRECPKNILDFPSGSGRVTRHLRAMFPSARIGACDLYRSHIEFCADQFGAEPLQSCEDLNQLELGQWDLIFCGSLLTHLPYSLFKATLRFIARSLTSQGLAIVTLEGRHSIYIQDNKWRLVDSDIFEVARQSYHETGFGYVDYNPSFREAAFSDQASYGVALVNPSRIMSELQELEDVRILGFRERAWDDHQDVVIFGKPGVNA